MIGRILISKSHGISNIIYSLSNISTDIDAIKDIQKAVNCFIWNNGVVKVKHSSMIGNYDCAGLKSIDIESQSKALRLAWVGRLWSGNGWSDIVQKYLEEYGGLTLLLKCNFDIRFMKYLPTFYREMLQYFAEIFANHYSKYIIWNNKNIIIDGKSIFYKEW